MSRPIKETPILRGKDTLRFLRKIAKPKKVSPEEMIRIRQDYDELKAIATF